VLKRCGSFFPLPRVILARVFVVQAGSKSDNVGLGRDHVVCVVAQFVATLPTLDVPPTSN